MIRPASGGWMGRGSGVSFCRPRCVRLRCIIGVRRRCAAMRPRRRKHLLDTHRLHLLDEVAAEDAGECGAGRAPAPGKWCAPRGVLATHPADQFATLFWRARPAAPSMPELPGPEPSEAFPVPRDHGLRLDNDEGASPVAPDLGQPCPEDSIGGGTLWPLR